MRKEDGASWDIAAVRARLAEQRGLVFWRSLEELAEDPTFVQFLKSEFPTPAPEGVDRRTFLKLMGASLALAGLSSACTRQPTEQIFPYTRAPEEIIPGKPLFYATAMVFGGFATGLIVESHMGRPTKIEGNPQHPSSLGATDVFAQAAILMLYDPDRSQVVLHRGGINTWTAFWGALGIERERWEATRGAGLRILTETVTSPTLADQLRQVLARFPEARWHQYEPVSRDHQKAGARLAFGRIVDAQYRLREARVVLSLEADFLTWGPNHLRQAREFISRRRAETEMAQWNRLYVFESTPSLTGAIADHRFSVRSSAIELIARALARRLGVEVPEPDLASLGVDPRLVEAIARDLERHRGESLVLVGETQPPFVHAIGHALNSRLGNVGRTVVYTEPVEAEPMEQMASLRELAEDMEAGRVDVLFIFGANPVYTAPADLQFAERMNRVRLRVHLGLYADETAQLCHWHLPESHFLEAWSDGRAPDGTVTIMQPLIAPLYETRSAHEVLAALLGQVERSGYEIVREYWQRRFEAGRIGAFPDFETFWRTALHEGIVPDTHLPPVSVSVQWEAIKAEAAKRPARAPEGVEIVFRPDPTVWDGRFANNGWLQELPKPLTKLTWDNAALISPSLAERLGVKNGDVIELQRGDRRVLAPVWIMPGQATETVTVHLGYGRWRAGRVGSHLGFNAYRLRTSAAPWFEAGIELRRTDRRHELVSTQNHHSMEGRHLVRVATLDEYQANPQFARELGHDPPPDLTLYPEHRYDGYSWGMVIDLNACIGCNACVIACQAENNIPVVGKREVKIGRAMHWIRIDRYFEGRDLERPDIYHQPVLCMHCDQAPCEVVCPTGATVHSHEGLNQMAYNRCVGTRYCSNNCPYKVRRFNFRLYADWTTETLKMQRNPDVTVRSRGVMEKCTYCVQRINAARIEAKKQERTIRDGEILTACQQACPTEAIIFGNLNDPESRVARLKAHVLNYGILTELNTRPRTTYLARLRNPNSEVVALLGEETS
ncbi:MAG: TAT-variant-translocated molybdopterin oxidoreductase [Blastocatellia bacterium]|nr:TAT-variant-translocated molybdopterin oxidoreductase [Blastocatellia bacterium]MDW8167445.1 TAT-variant-translocated molybdopterin oxidoreductase [Acidobacteriota bacterium]